MDISLIIVNYNTKDLTLSLLQDLTAQQTKHTYEIIVVDNASQDGSPQAIAKQFPQVHLIHNQTNRGFGVANNLGAKVARGDYLFFLNSDTRLKPDVINHLINHLKRHPSDIATCKLENPDGSLQPQGGHLPSLSSLAATFLFLDDIPLLNNLVKPYQLRAARSFTHSRRFEWVAATAMVVKAASFSALHGFDPQIFMYAEDVDLCWRALSRGMTIRYFATPTVTHLGQGSSTGSNASLVGEYQGLIYLYQKHLPGKLGRLKFLLRVGARLRIIIFAIMGRNDQKNIYRHCLKLAR